MKTKSLNTHILQPVLRFYLLETLLILLMTGLLTISLLIPRIQALSQDILASKTHSIEYFLDEQSEELKRLSQMLEDEETLDKALGSLKYISETSQEYESLGIVDRNGWVHVTSGVNFSIVDREYYQEIEKGGNEVYSIPLISRENDSLIVLILTPIHSVNNEVKYLSAAISCEYIEQVLSQANAHEFPMQIVDENGSVILSNGESVKGNEQIYESWIDGWDGMALRMLVPRSFFYNQLTYLIAGITLLAILISLIVRKILSQKITGIVEPINQIASQMDGQTKLERENFSEGMDVQEIRQLFDSYNGMVDNIENLMVQLEEKERLKQDAEYRALIQQIKPHFLYNTLEMIQSMCLDIEDERIEESIGMLADYFRSSLGQDKFLVPLKTELKQVEDYIALQQMRYQGKFTYDIVDETGGEMPFMRFTLQPIIENAIYHGVKKSEKKEHIHLVARCVEDELEIVVTNTYQQVNEDKIKQLNELFQTDKNAQSYPGYGLYNVNCRLKLNFGNQYHLRMYIEDHQVKTVVRHPMIDKDEMKDQI